MLKDAGKREKYDKVLKEGMPNWKSALYYYRRMRKVGLAEGLAIVMLIISVIQYATAWAAYAEKKYTAVSLVEVSAPRSSLNNDVLMFPGTNFRQQVEEVAEEEQNERGYGYYTKRDTNA